jgi:hypothetical protein
MRVIEPQEDGELPILNSDQFFTLKTVSSSFRSYESPAVRLQPAICSLVSRTSKGRWIGSTPDPRHKLGPMAARADVSEWRIRAVRFVDKESRNWIEGSDVKEGGSQPWRK